MFSAPREDAAISRFSTSCAAGLSRARTSGRRPLGGGASRRPRWRGELVAAAVDVIAAGGAPGAGRAKATPTIPILAVADDLVLSGSGALARPARRQHHRRQLPRRRARRQAAGTAFRAGSRARDIAASSNPRHRSPSAARLEEAARARGISSRSSAAKPDGSCAAIVPSTPGAGALIVLPTPSFDPIGELIMERTPRQAPGDLSLARIRRGRSA